MAVKPAEFRPFVSEMRPIQRPKSMQKFLMIRGLDFTIYKSPERFQLFNMIPFFGFKEPLA
ncbi:hypothetical protein EBR21_17220 [bacterium]|nr:hypothetical protein [bacterium]